MRNVIWKIPMIVGLVLNIFIIDSYAEEIPLQKRTYSSENGKYIVELKISEDWPDNYGNCQATFLQIEGTKRKIIWKRNLINDYAPSEIYISNSGKYVVTLDEYNPGYLAKLPLVIYGERGYIINVLSFKDFLTPEELNEHPAFMPWHGDSWWRDELVFFKPQDDTIFVRLPWGRIFAIQEGLVITENKWKDQKDWLKSEVEAICLKKLQSRYPDERYTGALIAGQEKMERTIPLLKALLKDTANTGYFPAGDSGGWGQMIVYWIRETAAKSLEAFGIKSPDVVFEARKYDGRKLTAAGAIVVARQNAKEGGCNLREYEEPTVTDKPELDTWQVFFKRKAAFSDIGESFSIDVHKRSHDGRFQKQQQ